MLAKGQVKRKEAKMYLKVEYSYTKARTEKDKRGKERNCLSFGDGSHYLNIDQLPEKEKREECFKNLIRKKFKYERVKIRKLSKVLNSDC